MFYSFLKSGGIKLSVELTEKELERYSRQIMLFGEEGQKRLKKARVLIVGVGGLGSVSSLYLAAAGVGRLILVDKERLELSNLNRQILYTTEDIGKYKAEVAARRLKKLNPEIEIEGIVDEITEDNVRDYVSKVDLVVDGLDNWKVRFILNKECVHQRKPFIHAGIRGMHGQLLVVLPGKGPCLNCIIPSPPKEEKHFPVLGTTPGILGLLQATEVIKILTNYGTPTVGKLIIYDGMDLSLREIKVSRRPNCPVCGGT